MFIFFIGDLINNNIKIYWKISIELHSLDKGKGNLNKEV